MLFRALSRVNLSFSYGDPGGKAMNSQETYQGQPLFIRDEQFRSAQRQLQTTSSLWRSLLSLIVLLALPCASFAQSALTDDADTRGSNPNLDLSATSNVYLRFKLTATLPNNTAGSSVAKATIKLYLGAVKSP